jgi:hypothetical protein
MSQDLSDISEDLLRLAQNLPAIPTPILAPVQVQEWILRILDTHSSQPSPNSQSPMHRPENILNVPTNILPIRVETNVELTRETTLSTLYIYDDPRFYLEYPETSTEGTGYLMRRDPDNWINPLSEITYSNGKPSGQTTRNKAKTCALLRDPTDPEKEILCIRKHTSCESIQFVVRILTGSYFL